MGEAVTSNNKNKSFGKKQNQNNNNNNGYPKKHNNKKRGFYEIEGAESSLGTSKLRKKIRDMERLMTKMNKTAGNANAEKKQELERTLQALKLQYADAMKANHEREVAAKYHKIRFVERKKAVRRVVQQVKKLKSFYDKIQAADEQNEQDQKQQDDEKELKLQLLNSEIELYYTIVFPRAENYISLYPSSDTVPEDLEMRQEIKAAVKKEIKRLTETGLLPCGYEEVAEKKKTNSAPKKDQKKNEETGETEETKEKEDKEESSEKTLIPSSKSLQYMDELRRKVIDEGYSVIERTIVSDIVEAYKQKKEEQEEKEKKNNDGDSKDKENKEQERDINQDEEKQAEEQNVTSESANASDKKKKKKKEKKEKSDDNDEKKKKNKKRKTN